MLPPLALRGTRGPHCCTASPLSTELPPQSYLDFRWALVSIVSWMVAPKIDGPHPSPQKLGIISCRANHQWKMCSSSGVFASLSRWVLNATTQILLKAKRLERKARGDHRGKGWPDVWQTQTPELLQVARGRKHLSVWASGGVQCPWDLHRRLRLWRWRVKWGPWDARKLLYYWAIHSQSHLCCFKLTQFPITCNSVRS